MKNITLTRLRDVLQRNQSTLPDLAGFAKQLEILAAQPEANALDAIIQLYEQIYPLLEKTLWSRNADFATLLHDYQSLFREQEALIQQQGKDDRYHFILSIPTADRPAHLHTCLESIVQICQLYGYGGYASGYYTRIKIIVADDSREAENIQRHIELVNEYRQKGLQVFYLDQTEQYALLQTLPPQQRERLGNILTTQPASRPILFKRPGCQPQS